MIKILRFAKKSWYIMVFIIALLFIQANAELALPEYTSRIVDIGIQYGGIEKPIPKAITETSLNHIKLFLTEADKETVDSYYGVMDETTQRKNYPTVTETMYEFLDDKLPKDGEEELDRISEIVIPAETLVAMLTSDGEEFVKIQEGILAAMHLDPSQVTDIFAVFAQMPPEAIEGMKTQMNEKMGDMADMIGTSMATTFVKQEYAAIGVNLDKMQMDYLKTTGLQMLGLALLSMAVAILVTYLSAKLAAVTSRDLRNKIFKKVVSFSNSEMNEFSTASLITRSTNDIQQVQMVLTMIFRIVAYAPIIGIGGIIKVLRTNSTMTWIIAVAVGAILCLVIILMVVAMPKFKKMQILIDRLNLVSREILLGIPVIRAFSREKHEEKRFEGANMDLMKNQLFTNRAMALMMPTMMFIMNGITVLIIWVGAHGIDMGNLLVGDMMAFITYTMQIVMSFLMITMISIMLPRAAVAAGRIEEVLNSKTHILDPKQPERMPEIRSGVRFEHVNFRYNKAKEDVLTDIDFTAKVGETTAIIGSTGCGKSTLVNLIPRLYDVTEGRIVIDGVDIRDVTLHDLREQIGFVPQKGVLFSGTIESNINFGLDGENETTIKEAAEIAQAADFIAEKPEQYQAEIAQSGGNVSGGQKQRLSIARAIAKNPKIYVFDDSFSALDYKTDQALRSALKKKTEGAVVLIVAQRISTILHAEKIVVLEDGKIVGIGSHEELLANNEVYQQIASSQLSQEELEGKTKGKEV